MLKVLQESVLLTGKAAGVDTTTLDANAAMRTIRRRLSGEGYSEWLTELARESGIEELTRAGIAEMGRKRPQKASTNDWLHPHDPEARVTKTKGGRAHLAHKLEVGVDMEAVRWWRRRLRQWTGETMRRCRRRHTSTAHCNRLAIGASPIGTLKKPL